VSAEALRARRCGAAATSSGGHAARARRRASALYEHLRRRYPGILEHVVDRYCVAGHPDECVARVREYIDAGAQAHRLQPREPEDAERLAEVVRAAAG
jgi:alkanesulfonate monooxygenase SsuD/methylene tetrahydromethanopterin reductase-like flavin-dependent oxidoreductase (luciferase family)